MDPRIWGKHGWKFLHTITVDYPLRPGLEEKQRYKNFFELLEFVLPCHTCRKAFGEKLVKFPIDPALESKKKLVTWLIDLHNDVNDEKGKTIHTYDQFMKNMNTAYKLPETNTTKYLVIVATIGMAIFMYRNKT